MSNRQYFEWLLDKTRCRYVNTNDYSRLLEYLFNYEFTWLIPFDSNRADNGISLRYEFESETGFIGRTDDEPCSDLEMLIALARDWEHEITYDFHKGDRSPQWFWTMINNLGLLEYPNWRISPGVMDEIDEILDVWHTRKFSETGIGSPFPVKNWYGDQKTVEIWMQLQNYVIENIEI